VCTTGQSELPNFDALPELANKVLVATSSYPSLQPRQSTVS
jgi:hypothetical protein